jgi:cytochrome P450 family 9
LNLKEQKVCGLYYLWKPVLLVTDPELIKSVLITDSSHFINHPPTTNLEATDRIAWSLFFMKDDLWKHRRAIFSSAFTPKR